MKKLFFLLILLPFFSCEGPMGPMGPIGPEGPEGPGVYLYSATVDVRNSDWVPEYPDGEDESRFWYYVDIEVPPLDQYVFEYGVVLVYMYTGNNVKQLLPSISYYGDIFYEEYWQYTFASDYYYDSSTRKGYIRIYAIDSEFYDEFPGAYTFDIKIVWD
ncbi:MAG: hypothetical protein LUG18_02775 [Candidatus Azobacteroides sp.]|nr:hypothetical protein [Candidatus Azobacteroides sp.]